MNKLKKIDFRNFQISDADTLISWASTQDELLQWSGPHFSFPLDEGQMRDYADSAGESRRLISGVESRTGALVAHAELNILSEHKLGQIRRVIVAPELRGQGVGRALIRWLVRLSFTELDLNRLELVVFSFNDRARHCYESAGFREEGRAEQARKASSDYWDLIYMALLKDWCGDLGEEVGDSNGDAFTRR